MFTILLPVLLPVMVVAVCIAVWLWKKPASAANLTSLQRVVLVVILVLGIVGSLLLVGFGLIGFLFWSSETESIRNALMIVVPSALGVLGVILCIVGIIRLNRGRGSGTG
jgi:Na+-transporting NADH:ubiquinone oxidoreductase subunit NqrD